jgi:hypothetical protein
VLPGIIGVVQATEAIKVLLGVGEPLIGRLMTYDALGMRFREVKLRRDPKCPLCGEHPTIKDLAIHRRRRQPARSATTAIRPQPSLHSKAGRLPACCGGRRRPGPSACSCWRSSAGRSSGGGALQRQAAALIHGIDLVIHEAGHTFALFLPRFIHVLAGSALQVFCRRLRGTFAQRASSACCRRALLTGESVTDVAIYG